MRSLGCPEDRSSSRHPGIAGGNGRKTIPELHAAAARAAGRTASLADLLARTLLHSWFLLETNRPESFLVLCLNRMFARTTATPPVDTNPPSSKAVVEMQAGHIGILLLARELSARARFRRLLSRPRESWAHRGRHPSGARLRSTPP